MPHKLSISNIAWPKAEDDAVYSLMAKYGFTGLEIAPSRTWDNPYEQNKNAIIFFKNNIKKYHLDVVSLQALLFNQPELTIFTDPKARTKTLEHLKKNIILAHNLGAKALVFGSPKNRVIGTLDAHVAQKIAMDFFGELGSFAAQHGVYFCMEPNPKIYGTDFICTTVEAIQLVQTINSPGLKVNIDLGTISVNNEDLRTTLLHAIPNAGHFHISEPFLEEINLDRSKHEKIREILKQNPSRFALSIEMKINPKHTTTERLQTIEKTLCFISSIYGPH